MMVVMETYLLRRTEAVVLVMEVAVYLNAKLVAVLG
jgi:hypothetical protein